MTLTYFKIGDRVMLRPPLLQPDSVIQGTLERIGRKFLAVRLDNGTLLDRLHPADIRRGVV